MKRFLLTIIAAITALAGTGVQAQKQFEWGTAEWNIEEGTTFNSISELKRTGITLTYSNPSNYTLTFFNIIGVGYDLYVDDASEPVRMGATSANGNTVVDFTENYSKDFVEGHTYRIVTTDAILAQANLSTRTTDTISTNTDSYSITFRIIGPELVNTIEVESTMALTITDQEWEPTYSVIDAEAIKKELGISDISEATIWGLNSNGSYNEYFRDPFDGWRDAEGEYTVWGGNAYQQLGHNAYPAVYCIKLNETVDTVKYYFYDYWREYDPEDTGETGGGTILQVKRRAPDTHYNNVIWDWDNGDGTTTQYTRYYRVDEGEDYKASFAIIANEKMVKINATLHFVSEEAYAEYQKQNEETLILNDPKSVTTGSSATYNINGTRTHGKGFQIVRQTDGIYRKVLFR